MPNETYEEWEGRLKRICLDAKESNFKIGDCLIEGELSYGERYSQALEETGLRYDTLAHIRYVCSRVKPECRLLSLSFTHHRAVAHLSPEEQKNWLFVAAQEKLSTAQFRQRLAGTENVKMICGLCRGHFEKERIKRISLCESCREESHEQES